MAPFQASERYRFKLNWLDKEIVTSAEREGVDLIAITSHGRTGLSQVFYGSVAAGVLHCVSRPLLLIRSRNDQAISGFSR